MNRTEAKAKAWLEQQQIRNLTFQSRRSPDFLGADGRGYEVKLIYENSITFSRKQVRQLVQHGNVTVLAFAKDGDEPVTSFPFSEAKIPGHWGTIRLDVVSGHPLLYISKELYDELVKLGEDPGRFAAEAVRERLEVIKKAAGTPEKG